MRKPNLSEASDQFSKLAKKVKTNEEPQYEGMCHLAIARCEQNIGNNHGEVEALISASRCYLEAEKRIYDLKTPTFNENLTTAIQSYNHAIRLLEENGDLTRAAGLCLELGETLMEMQMRSEALTFYKRATELLPKSSLSYLHAKEKVAKTFVKMKDYHNAVNVFTDIANSAEQLSRKPATSVTLDILARYCIITD